eukprot:GHRR01027746.1.p1 GENE.GHRR01027746.1~~GHRR01027746.1.p1  ORF type:complete len:270 (+),score=92.70 GHRR01027746.1:1122-1931(+)
MTCCYAAFMYYYETIFPRIPKKVEDEIQAGLRARGLPTKGKGNGGCGGPDRRGADDGNRRPASVKASLSVAFGQRAPNRAGTKDTSRWKGAAEASASGRDRAAADRENGGSRGGYRSRSRSLSREVRRNGGTPDRYNRDRGYDSRDRERRREHDSRGDRDSRDYRGSARDRDRYDSRIDSSRSGRDHAYDSRDRDRSTRYPSHSRSRSRQGGGRDARDVFKERVTSDSAAAVDIRSRYGDACGKLDLASSAGRSKRTADEVFRLGSKKY